MLSREFDDFCGDGEYVIWIAETGEGMLIWEGYFDTIMDRCWISDYSDKGMLYCYNQLTGFCNEEVWEMKHLDVVLGELNAFDEKNPNVRLDNGEVLKDDSLLDNSKKVLHRMVDLIKKAKKHNMRVFIASDWCYEDAEQFIRKVR